ncbi:MAG TPA: FAD-binding oxidoreductase [bacterium]|nr:FAD-binding oxidoreductase [bacterium]
MPQAEIVIIGGGVIGTSTAFQLARRHAGRVIVLERETVGAGPTARTIGIIRLHYSHEPLIRMAARGLEVFRRFEAVTGATADFVPAGFLVLADASQLAALEANVALQRRLGVRTSVLTPAELARLEPRLDLHGIAGAAYEPDAGYADGHAAAAGFAAAARRGGVEIWERTRAEHLVVERGALRAVVTTRGIVETGRALLAAGAWTPALLATVGATLPIQAAREQVVHLALPAGFGPLRLMIEDLTQGFYVRPESHGTALAGVLEEAPEQIVPPDDYPAGVDLAFVERVGALWARRYPGAADAAVRGGYASIYDVTPDWQPVLGAMPGVEGLYVAAGFSGHGFKLSPAVGEALAALLVGDRPEIDIGAFHPSRFAEGRLLRGKHAHGILG